LFRLARELDAEAAAAPPEPKREPPPQPKIKIDDPALEVVTERLEQKLDEVAKVGLAAAPSQPRC
jgi:hypothetical protein